MKLRATKKQIERYEHDVYSLKDRIRVYRLVVWSYAVFFLAVGLSNGLRQNDLSLLYALTQVPITAFLAVLLVLDRPVTRYIALFFLFAVALTAQSVSPINEPFGFVMAFMVLSTMKTLGWFDEHVFAKRFAAYALISMSIAFSTFQFFQAPDMADRSVPTYFNFIAFCLSLGFRLWVLHDYPTRLMRSRLARAENENILYRAGIDANRVQLVPRYAHEGAIPNPEGGSILSHAQQIKDAAKDIADSSERSSILSNVQAILNQISVLGRFFSAATVEPETSDSKKTSDTI